MDIRPIRNDADHARALAQMEELWGAPEGSAEAELLDVLVTLVNAFEAEHQGIESPDPIEAIRFRMEQIGMSRKELAPMLGGRARVSEILNRKRPLTLSMIRRLRSGLGLSADVLVGGEEQAAGAVRRDAGQLTG